MSIHSSLPSRNPAPHFLVNQLQDERQEKLRQWYLETYGENGEALFQTHIQNPPLNRLWRKRRTYRRIPSRLADHPAGKANPGSIGRNSPVVANGRELLFSKNRLYRTNSGREEIRVAFEPVTRGELIDQPFVHHSREQQRQKDQDLLLRRFGLDLAVPYKQIRRNPVHSIPQGNNQEKVEIEESVAREIKKTASPLPIPEQQSNDQPAPNYFQRFLQLVKKIIRFVATIIHKIYKWLTKKNPNNQEDLSTEPLLETQAPSRKRTPPNEQIVIPVTDEDTGSDDELLDLF